MTSLSPLIYPISQKTLANKYKTRKKTFKTTLKNYINTISAEIIFFELITDIKVTK